MFCYTPRIVENTSVKGPLTNVQLESLILTNWALKYYYQGVYAANCLPPYNSLKPLSFIIVNRSSLHNKGTHWVLLIKNVDHSITHFCSMGERPKNHILQYLTANGKYHVISTRFQSMSSALCGGYCIFYAYWRCVGGYSDADVTQHLGENGLPCNEKEVAHFTEKLRLVTRQSEKCHVI